MQWFYIFQAAIQTLTALSSGAVAMFHGGAQHSAEKVQSAFAVLNTMTNNIASGLHPMTSIDESALHPQLAAHAANIAANDIPTPPVPPGEAAA